MVQLDYMLTTIFYVFQGSRRVTQKECLHNLNKIG